jgi:hypothetical protein
LTRACVLFAFLSFFGGCGKSKPISGQDDQSHSSLFSDMQSRLVSSFLPGGFVISETSDHQITDQGDSLLFTGLALGVLDCDQIPPILAGMENMQKAFKGYLVRFYPLPDEYVRGNNFVSRDGATGALFGLERSKRRCPAFASRIDGIIAKWMGAIGDDLWLYPGSLAGIITPSFHSFLKMGRGIGVSDLDFEEYHLAALTTALFITKEKQACYPIHLQTIQDILIEQMGRPLLKRYKDEWCAVVQNKGLLLTDWYCGKNTDQIQAWLSHPESSSHVYMHQRCSWESTDSDGKISPRVDFLLLHRLFQEGSSL